jgi:chemotaxis protein CheZ
MPAVARSAGSTAGSEKTPPDPALGLASIRDGDIAAALDQLAAVIETTEDTTNRIIDACDALAAVARHCSGEEAECIGRAITAICEACSFQDLTGQRLVRVARALGLVGSKLGRIPWPPGVAGDGMAEQHPAGGGIPETPGLCGPQRPEQAIDQDGVDRLLAQLG